MKRVYFTFAILVILQLPLFAQQADFSLVPYRKGNLWGYADRDKNLVIQPVYDEANLFYLGYASVRKGNLFGYINKAGRLVIPYKFYSAKRFRYGYTDNVKTNGTDTVLFAGAALTEKDIERCIDTRGKQMLKCPAINENTRPDSAVKLITDTSISIYSTFRKSETFDKVVDGYKMPGSDDDYYIAMKGDQFGVINNKFERIAPFEYTSINKLVVGNSVYLIAKEHGLVGLLGGNGSVQLPLENTRIDPVTAANGKVYLIVTRNGNTGIKDLLLQQLVPEKYSDIQYNVAGGFLLTGTNGLKGYFFGNNKLIETGYTDITPLTGGNYIMTKNQVGKSGYINDQGVEFFEQ